MAEVANESSAATLVEQARETLIEIYQELASSEALTRALVSERDGNRDIALMWVEVYKLICLDDAKPTGSAIIGL